MAHVDRIWLNDAADKEPAMRVYVKMKPAGEVTLIVKLPEKFREAILKLAQAEADRHEALMQAEILGERHDAA